MTPKTKAARMLDTTRTAPKKNQSCQFTQCLFSEQSTNADCAGSVSTREGNVNVSLDSAQKRFATLAAQFALAGHCLIRSNPADGAAAFYATRWGMIKFLPTLDAARAFLAQIGGSK